MEIDGFDLSYSNNPSYFDLFFDSIRILRCYFSPRMWRNYTMPNDLVNDFIINFDLPLTDIFRSVIFAILFTVIRHLFDYLTLKFLVKFNKVDKISNVRKLTESIWNFLVYSFLWLSVANLLVFSGKYDYFTKPYNAWKDWKFKMDIPSDIKIVYLIELGFYLHCMYSIFFIETKLKDFQAQVVHHLVTIALISLTYAYRYHKYGLVTLFCHQITDIPLEFAKINRYLKSKNITGNVMHERLTQVSFVIFAISWLIFRMYWYPLKVVYSTLIVSAYEGGIRGAKFYVLFNMLLGILMLLNLYWFYMIINVIVKISTGKGNLEDVREEKAQSHQKL